MVETEPAFGEWRPPKLEEPKPPASSLTKASRPVDQLRVYFGAVWVGQIAARIGGVILLTLAAGMLLVAMYEAADVSDWWRGRRMRPSAWPVVAVAAPVASAVGGGIALLAIGELLTATGWFFIRQGIGGNGPIAKKSADQVTGKNVGESACEC